MGRGVDPVVAVGGHGDGSVSLEISPPLCERLSYQRVGVGTEQEPPRRLHRLGSL